jgi:hypothetical protein
MNWKPLVLPAAVCSLCLIASALGIVWYATSPLRGDIDGLLLLAICSLIGAIFFVQLYSILQTVWRARARSLAAAVRVPWKDAIKAALAQLRTALTRVHN